MNEYEFLKKTENHFNWQLSRLDVNHNRPMLTQLKDRLDDKNAISDSSLENKWPLQLTYGYELFSEDPQGALECVDDTIRDISTSQEPVIVKYRVPYFHIAHSTKAFMLSKIRPDRAEEMKLVVGQIKPKSNMSDFELAGLLAMKAQMLRYYGPDGTTKGLPLLREAVRKNPHEVEWKISLVVSLNRKRHVFKGQVDWNQIEEPVNILEELLSRSDLTEKQTVECKYYLAVAYRDFIMGKPRSADTVSCRSEIMKLCNEIHDKTDFPPFLAFCAERFSEDSSANARRGWKIVENLLERFPTSVSINVTACKILKRQGDLATAANHAQIALDNDCYGSAWLWLECKSKLNEEPDLEEFIQKILSGFQKMYRKLTFLNASMYYFFVKKDPVFGAHYFERAIDEDPDFDALRKPWSAWYLRKTKICPIEVAYNQIVLSLQTCCSKEDCSTLNSAKRRIEQVTDVKTFPKSQNLVKKPLKIQSIKYQTADSAVVSNSYCLSRKQS